MQVVVQLAAVLHREASKRVAGLNAPRRRLQTDTNTRFRLGCSWGIGLGDQEQQSTNLAEGAARDNACGVVNAGDHCGQPPFLAQRGCDDGVAIGRGFFLA